MKKRNRPLSTVFLLFFLLILFCSAPYATADSLNGKEVAAIKGKTRGKLESAGMNVHLLNHNKSHSVKAMITVPGSNERYIPARVHLNPTRDRVISGHIGNSFYIQHGSYQVKIDSAVLDKSGKYYVGQGTIESLHLPGVMYSHRILFNSKGIISISNLEKRGQWKIAGFYFSPSGLEWTKSGVKATGMLAIKYIHPEINILIKPNGLEIAKLLEPVTCIIDHQIATVTGIKIKDNRIYLSGYSKRHNPKNPQHFKDAPVGPSGYIKVNFKKPPRAKDRNYHPKKLSRDFHFSDTASYITGLAGLPGEMLIKISGTDMTMRVISEQKEGGATLYDGYVSLPNPVGRANIYKSVKSGTEARLDNAKIYWQKEKFKIPFIDSVVTSSDPVTYENGKFTSPIFGDIQISEFIAPSAKIIADSEEIDYKVSSNAYNKLTLKGATGSIISSLTTPDIEFDVIQGRDWIGFKFYGTLGSLTFGPTNVSWYDPSLITGPSLYLEVHNTGYIKLDVVTGSECVIPIVPDMLNLVSPEVHYLRYPSLMTELWLKGNFQPPPPIIGGKVFKMIGTFFVDVNGMGSSQVGSASVGDDMKMYILGFKIGESTIDFDGNSKTFVYQGDIEVFGYKLAEGNLKLFLGNQSLLAEGSASIHIIFWIGVKFKIYRSGHFHLGFGHYNFKTHKGGGPATYKGPFSADGIKYTGTMTLDPKKGITMSGSTGSKSASSGNDSVTYNFSIDGSMDDSGSVVNGTITPSALSLDLQPIIPQCTDPVEIDLNGLSPTFTKDPQSGEWQMESTTVNVSFSYTDKNGDSQSFSQNCSLKMYLNNSTLHLDLGIPPEYGGTYSQSFSLSSTDSSQ